jgi:exosortase/archaeosortase family protein
MRFNSKGYIDYLSKDRILAASISAVLIVILFFLLGGNSLVKHIDIYQSFFDSYTHFQGRTITYFLNLMHENATYLPSQKSVLLNGTNTIPLYSNFALRYYIYVIVVLLVLPKKYLKSFLLMTISFFLLFLLSSLMCVFEIKYYDTFGSFLGGVIVGLRPVLLICLIVFKIDNNDLFKRIYIRANSFVRERINFSIFQILLLFFLITPVFGLINYIIMNDFKVLLNDFSKVLLSLSHLFLTVLNYSTNIVGRSIYLGKYSVYLGDPCLGIIVTLTFIFIIYSIKSSWLNRLIFMVLGSIVMIIMNSVRIAYLLIHLHKYGHYTLTMEVHELSDYFFYIIVFLMVILYLFWFQHIQFKSKKMII